MTGAFFCCLILLLPGPCLWLSPKLLRPTSHCPPDAPVMRFTLIDLAALTVILGLIPVGLKSVSDADSLRDEPALLLLMLALAMILTAVWGHGTRCLSAHGVLDWKARAAYLLLAIPGAYGLPIFATITLGTLLIQEWWPSVISAALTLICLVITRTISTWVARKATTPPVKMVNLLEEQEDSAEG